MPSPQTFYRTALACGLVPLATGVGIFLVWLKTHGEWTSFLLPGISTILGGLLAVLVGGGALVAYVIQATATEPLGLVLKRVLIGAAVLLVNFPAALGILIVVGYVVCTSNLKVINGGPAIDRLMVWGGGAKVSLGPIAAGETATHSFMVTQDGSLQLRASRGGETADGPLEPYVTPGPGDDIVVTFAPDGTWTSQTHHH